MTWKKAYDSRRVDRIQGEFFTRSALVSFLGCFDNVLALVLALREGERGFAIQLPLN